MWMSGSFTTWPDHRVATGLALGGFPRRQLIAVTRIAGWNVEVERHQVLVAVVTNFVTVPVLDEKQRSRGETIAAPVDDSDSRTSNHQEPLIGAAMAVLAAAFRFSRRQHHLGRLRSAISQNDVEALAEPKSFMLHRGLLLESMNIDQPRGGINRCTQLIVVGRLPSAAQGLPKSISTAMRVPSACTYGKANLAGEVARTR